MSRWNDIDRIVLKAIYRLAEASDAPNLDKRQIAELADVDIDQLDQSLGYLAADRLIQVIDASGRDGPDYMVEGVTPEGLRAIGEWPTDERLAQILSDILKELAVQADDPDQANVLEKAGGIIGNIPTPTLVTLTKSIASLN